MSDFVTRDEFGALRDDVREIRTDVKTLLIHKGGDEAVSSWQRWFFGIVFTGSFTAIATVLYVSLIG